MKKLFRIKLSHLLIFIVVSINGCASYSFENSTKDQLKLLNFKPPENFSVISQNIQDNGEIDSLKKWILTSNNQDLIELMNKAIANNSSIAIARSNLLKATAIKNNARGDLLPKGNLGIAANQQRTRLEKSPRTTSYKSNIGVSWELDLFGKNLDNYQAKSYNLLATNLQLHYTQQVVLSQLLRSWLGANSAHLQILEAKKNLELLIQKKNIFEMRYQSGTGTIDAIAQIKNEINQAKTNIRNLEFNKKNFLRNIQVLIGEYPDGKLRFSNRMIETRNNLNLKPPVELLQNRPDVLSAYIELLSKKAELASALKNKWLPTLSFSIEGSTTANIFADILTSPNIWNLGLQLIKNIFSNQEQQKLKLANEDEAQALINYVAKVIEAFEETENAIEDEVIAQNNQRDAKSSLKRSENLFTIANNRYQSGLIDAEVWIERLRAKHSAHQQWLSAYEKWLTAQINVLMALGDNSIVDDFKENSNNRKFGLSRTINSSENEIN